MSEVPELPYSTRLRLSLAIARGIAATRGDTDLSSLHVALGLLRERENTAVAALMHAGVSTDTLRREIEQALGAPQGSPRDGEICIDTTPGEQRILANACNESRKCGDKYLGPHHLLLGLVQNRDSRIAHILARHGIDPASARSHVDAIVAGDPRSDPPPAAV